MSCRGPMRGPDGPPRGYSKASSASTRSVYSFDRLAQADENDLKSDDSKTPRPSRIAQSIPTLAPKTSCSGSGWRREKTAQSWLLSTLSAAFKRTPDFQCSSHWRPSSELQNRGFLNIRTAGGRLYPQSGLIDWRHSWTRNQKPQLLTPQRQRIPPLLPRRCRCTWQSLL